MSEKIEHKGTVKWFSRLIGYGFITPDDGGDEVFVHFSAIADQEGYRNLDIDQRVSYTLRDVGKGAQAQNVKRIDRHLTASDRATAR